MSGPSRRLVLAVTSHITVNLLLLPQLARLRKAGWEIHVVCAPGPVSAEVYAFATEVHLIPMRRATHPVQDAASLAAMVRLLRRLRPDVVVGSTPKAAMISMIGARLAGVPVRIFQIRGLRWGTSIGRRAALMKLGDRAAAASATDVLAVSPSVARAFVDEGVVHRLPIVLGHGGSKGVDTSLFFPDPDRAIDPVAPVLGFAGRLSIDKGVGHLIDVVALLRQSSPALRLQVIGDLDEAQPISPRLIDALTHGSGVEWIGALPPGGLAERMRTWDLLVFPSHREGLPNVVIEAGASGVPTVAWDVTGVRDAVDAPLGGRLLPFGDVPAMVEAVRDCLEPAVHARMREHAASWTRASFDAEVLQEYFIAYLNDACSRSDERRRPRGV